MNPKIKYGNVNLTAEDLEPKNVKVRISMWMAGDVLDAYKAKALEQGLGYQTLMQQTLRNAIEGGGHPVLLPAHLQEEFKALQERVAKLERRLDSRKEKKRA